MLLYAYDFEVDGKYYNILPGRVNEVEITRKGFGYTYEGEQNIPSEVEYNGITYKVTAVGISAFNNCGKLSGIVLPDGITAIRDGAFTDCKSLTTFRFPKRLKTIGKIAFSGCEGLTGRLILPDSLESIGERAFFWCKNLNGSLVLPNSIESIDAEAFVNCGFDGDLFLPEGISNISESCFNLTNFKGYLYIPDNVERIFKEAFRNCKFSTVRLPKKISYIYSSAFSDCSNLSTVSCEASKPCDSQEYIFNNILYSAVLQVPIGTKEKYVNSSWSAYFNEIKEVKNATEKFPIMISSSANGKISIDDMEVCNSYDACFVKNGTSVTFAINPDEGYRIKKVRLNDDDITFQIANNTYTTNVNKSIRISVEFIEKSAAKHVLSIKATGNGVVKFNKSTIKEETKSFQLEDGETANLSFSYDSGYYIKALKVNSTDETDNIVNNAFAIGNITKDIRVDVEFLKIIDNFEKNGVYYIVTSFKDKTVVVGSGKYNLFIDIPATVTYQDYTWTVVGINQDVIKENPSVASIIWHPEIMFDQSITNPNFLLYVVSANYAPVTITNVIVNGNAEKIILKDATDGNNFYCPKEFTAKNISYTHNYGMTTGYGESKGWDTIVLPFDVQKIIHPSKGELTPYSNWKSGDDKKPFWLMEFGTGGWTHARKILANIPYIISMPNHTNYKPEFRVNGSVTFSADNAKVKASDNIQSVKQGGKSFVPNYSNQASASFYSLNINSDYTSYTGEYTEGSRFVLNLRPVHPFEAYMTSVSNATRSIAISDDMTTGLEDIIEVDSNQGNGKIYNLKGLLIKAEKGKSIDETIKELPAGVYIVNGKKLIIK